MVHNKSELITISMAEASFKLFGILVITFNFPVLQDVRANEKRTNF
jgi:hypothetical protein